MEAGMKASRNYLVIGLAALVFVLLVYAIQQTQRAEEAEQDLPYETAKILSAEFAESAALRVLAVSGDLVVTASDEGLAGLIPTSQKRRLPYSVDYFVDLSDVGIEKYRWLPSERTMIVEIPDVTVSRPNIDEAKSVAETPDGIFVSRGASARLQQKIAARATGFAAAEAQKPENMNKARRSARDQIQKILAAPLAAAGLGNIVVVTRFPWETGGVATERWDESTPLVEIAKQK
jgi:hypothetical protein